MTTMAPPVELHRSMEQVLCNGNNGDGAFNTGSLVKSGNTFTGWNTAANGSGITYAPGATFAISSNTTLYAQWSPITFTLNYDDNGSTGGAAPIDGASPYVTGTTVTVLSNTGSLVKSGNTFTGWNTAANGSGITYAPGATFAISSNTTLYAQWSPITFTLNYDDNGSTGGAAPIDGASPYVTGTTVTVLSNTGSLVKSGNTFTGWNTAANGSGITYAPGATFAISSNTTLYAQWSPITFTLNYDDNGSTGGAAPIDGASPYVTGTTVTVLSNTGSLVKSGNTFTGWNTAANGSGITYAPGATFAISSNTTLYAQWSPITFTLSYDDNGSTGGAAPIDGASPYVTGTTVTVLSNTGSLVKSGNTFTGWNTAANGSGITYAPGATFAISSNTTLYAQWSPITFTLNYDDNGSTGGAAPIDGASPYVTGTTVTVLSNTGSLVKSGNTFTGWNTAANGSGITYAPGATFAISSNTTLYAQWSPITFTLNYDDNGSTGGAAPIDGASPYVTGTTVTVLSNTGSLVKSGNTFTGWNTAANGSGITYAPGATFAISSNTTLYAQWSPITFTLNYDDNGSTGGAAPIDGASPYVTGTTVTVLSNTGSLVKSGNTFTGWNTAANGSGITYAPGATFAISSNTTLYAQWSPITFTLNYDDNGSTGGAAPIDGASPYVTGTTVTVLSNTGSLVKSGNTFTGWNTAANGSGSAYAPAATFAIGANTTLYAQWSPITSPAIKVTFNGNGATDGRIDPQSGDSPSPLKRNEFTKQGFTFSSWNSMPDGTGIRVEDGVVFAFATNLTLYAQWVAVVVVIPPTPTPVETPTPTPVPTPIETPTPVPTPPATSPVVLDPIVTQPPHVTPAKKTNTSNHNCSANCERYSNNFSNSTSDSTANTNTGTNFRSISTNKY